MEKRRPAQKTSPLSSSFSEARLIVNAAIGGISGGGSVSEL